MWRSAERILAAMRTREIAGWTATSDSAEAWMGSTGQTAGCRKHTLEQTPGERGGGIVGSTTELEVIRERATASGHRALDQEARLARLRGGAR